MITVLWAAQSNLSLQVCPDYKSRGSRYPLLVLWSIPTCLRHRSVHTESCHGTIPDRNASLICMMLDGLELFLGRYPLTERALKLCLEHCNATSTLQGFSLVNYHTWQRLYFSCTVELLSSVLYWCRTVKSFCYFHFSCTLWIVSPMGVAILDTVLY